MADAQTKQLSKSALSLVALRCMIRQQSKQVIFSTMKSTAFATDKNYESAYKQAAEDYKLLTQSTYYHIITDHRTRYEYLLRISELYGLVKMMTKINDRMSKLFLAPDTAYKKEDEQVRLSIENSRYDTARLSHASHKKLENSMIAYGGDDVKYKEIIYSPKLLREFHRQVKRSLYSRSYYHFYKWVFALKEPTNVFSENWHINYLCDTLQERAVNIINGVTNQKNLLINLPPRGSKTLICNVFLNLWVWIRDPSFMFIAISHGADIIDSQNTDAMSMMEHPTVLEVFPELKMSSKRKSKADFGPAAGSGSRWGKSLGGQIIGKGANIMVVDDPISADNSKRKVERDRVIHSFRETLTTRTQRPETFVMVIVMQRLHENDLSGYLMAQDSFHQYWELIKLPAYADSEKDVFPQKMYAKYKEHMFWPSYLTTRFLDERRLMLGTAYNGQYLQNPIPSAGNIILTSWILTKTQKEAEEETKEIPTHFIVDPSLGEGDPTGCIAFRKTATGLFYVIDAWCKALEVAFIPTEIHKYVVELTKGDDRSVVHIEHDSIGKSLISFMDNSPQDYPFRYASIDVPEKRDSKEQRIASVSSSFARGRVFFCRDNGWYNEMVYQLTAYPNAGHDEYIDCIAWMLLLNKRNQVIFPDSIKESYQNTPTHDPSTEVDPGDFPPIKPLDGNIPMPPGVEGGVF